MNAFNAAKKLSAGPKPGINRFSTAKRMVPRLEFLEPRELEFFEIRHLQELQRGELRNNCQKEIDFSDAPLANKERLEVAAKICRRCVNKAFAELEQEENE